MGCCATWAIRIWPRSCALPQAEVSFNYLGQFDNIFAEGAPFRLLQEPVGPLHGPRGQRFHLIEITGQVAGGRLHMEWVYSPQLHRRATIEALAEGFMAALRELIAARHAGRTADGSRDIEESYQLAPGQQAMLAHALREPMPSVYALQWRCALHGALDVAAFRQAWQRAIERHAILRSSFVWEKQAQPLQIVHRHATALWQQHDLRKQVPAEQQIQLDALLAGDQARAYDLSRAAAAADAGSARRRSLLLLLELPPPAARWLVGRAVAARDPGRL